MGTISSIIKQAPAAKAPREFPTEWTWYAEDRPEKNKTEQSSRKTICPGEAAALRIVIDAAKDLK
jgi:hypothetical protein